MTETLVPLGNQDLEQSGTNFASHLKPVFDACDYNGDGFVKIQDLIELGQQHSVGNGEELKLLLQQLDCNGEGRITFSEFTTRVAEILQQAASLSQVNSNNQDQFIPEELSPVQEEAPSPDFIIADKERLTIPDEQQARSHTDSEGFFEEMDSHSTTSTNDYIADIDDASPLKHNNLQTPTNFFTKMKQESSIYSTYPPKGTHPRKVRSSLFDMRQRALSRTSEYQSQEEGFEAFGEGNDFDESVTSEPLMRPIIHLSPSDSQISRRLSGSMVAHQLRQVQSARTSLHGSMEDIKLQVVHQNHAWSDCDEGEYFNLSEEIKKLSSQLTIMKMDQDDHDDKQKKIREENRMLVNRINSLEEQLQDQKTASIKTFESESQKYRKDLNKVQRDHNENIDKLQMKLHEAELEIQNLKTVEPMLRKEIESSLEERRQAQRRIEELQDEIVEKEKEIEQLKYKLRSKVDELEREKSDRAQEVLILTQEIENLKYMKTAALNQYDEKNDLIKQLDLIKKENDRLTNTKDDLKNQLYEQHTVIEMQKEHTLADELAHAHKDDVLDALRGEENENHRLKQYIDQLLSLIMQSDPTLLEK